ncbi:hypothetical protein L6452_38593 [Arctium lappa]|uniref:Uncharacterized protein n=1 Tax=Arctium lappa TaxID=4217 RepID=A0ACB8XQI9_ARCLA|nr:hypothetical protein L6452_38593 [Arctium lappa]
MEERKGQSQRLRPEGRRLGPKEIWSPETSLSCSSIDHSESVSSGLSSPSSASSPYSTPINSALHLRCASSLAH